MIFSGLRGRSRQLSVAARTCPRLPASLREEAGHLILHDRYVEAAMPAHQGKFVAYFRVSTDRQRKSGLGLEAQRKAVFDYLDGGRWALVAEFTEVESGKRSDRLELERALGACKKHRAKLVIAKAHGAPIRLAKPPIQPLGSKRAGEKNPRQKPPGWSL